MSVIPRSAWAIGLVLGMLALAVTVDVFRTGGRGYLAIATPLVCGIWLLATSFLCLWLYWPGCKPPDTWFPGFACLSTHPPVSHVFRSGLLVVSLLFATTVWLYGELVIPHLVEYIPPEPVLNTSSPNTTSVEQEAMVSDELANGSDELANGSAGNGTSNTTPIVIWAPNASFKWGYGAAAGIAIQAAFKFEQRWCVNAIAHCVGVVLFGGGAMQHALLTNVVMASSRAKAITDTSPWLAWLVKFRQRVTDMAPIVLLATPLLGQMFSGFKTKPNRAGNASMRSILKESGTITSAVAAQWALAVLFALFYGTWAFDFYIASQLS